MQGPATAATAARSLGINAVVSALPALAVLATGPLTAGAHGFASPLAWLLLLAFSLMTLAFSLHLLFDAALLRLAASHDDETAGLVAIDDVLNRMRLRAVEPQCRPLDSRISGARRIVWRQRLALGATLLVFAILLLDASDGLPRC